MWINPEKFSLRLNPDPQKDLTVSENYFYSGEDISYFELKEIADKFYRLFVKTQRVSDFAIETVLHCFK